MSKIDDGGPAYPVPYLSRRTATGETTLHECSGGKSLRAEFAGIFAAAMIAAGGKVSPAEDRIGERMCGVAVAMADTLIAELRKGEAS